MAAEKELLRSYELRLLRCTLPPDNSTPVASPSPLSSADATRRLHSLIDDIVSSIEAGRYVQALSSDSARAAFKFIDSLEPFHDSVECADRLYSDLLSAVDSFLMDGADDDTDRLRRAVLLMSVATAAFLAFTQSNVTGPKEELPLFPLGFTDKSAVGCGANWEVWAHNRLMLVGSDLFGKFSNIQYMVFARMLLMRIKDFLFKEHLEEMGSIRSISWWLARILLLHQRMLDERSSSLFDLLQVFIGQALNHFGTIENVTSYWGAMLHEEEAFSILSMLHVEAGIIENTYGRVDACRVHLESAEVASGLQLSVAGALGFRTVHQAEPKAQLVLVANKITSYDADTRSTMPLEHLSNVYSIDVDNKCVSRHETVEASDILMIPRLLESDSDSGIGANGNQNGGTAIGPLKGIQQLVILARCLLIEKSTRHDEMQRWEMAPYIEAIDSQQSSYFIIQCFCSILRIRWESTRSCTKERALLMMDKLVHNVYESSPGVGKRIYFCFAVYIPTIPALQKEYGELLVSCGLIGEAVKIFEGLELWDNLIFCYSLLEKKAAAVELIKKRLAEMPRDARLWSLLGDVTNNDAYHEKALEVSNNRYARAKRSLARSAYNRGDYDKSKILWESAMALNSLYPDGWFALGAAALKARDVEKALDGFTRAVQLDPENGEAWNNIACLHMIKKRSKEAFIAFKEALKFKRNSWQLWENYSHVAVDTGHFGQALEAIQMVLDMTGSKRTDVDLLDRLMLEMERKTTAVHAACLTSSENNCANLDSANSYCDEKTESTSSVSEVARSRETEHFVELLGKILQQIVRSGGGAEIWGLYARWHKIQGDLTMCSEALLKQVRSYQGSDLWKDRERFRKFASASLKLCKVYMEISSSMNSRRELFAAEMHLKNIFKQAGSFSEMQEFKDLQACFDEVRNKLQQNSNSVHTIDQVM